MAIDALFGCLYTFLHDLESFFWVLFWICVHCEGPSGQGKMRYRHIEEFEKWNHVDPQPLAVAKGGTISLLNRRKDIFSEYRQPLVACLVELSKAICADGPAKIPESENLYDEMKRFLENPRR